MVHAVSFNIDAHAYLCFNNALLVKTYVLMPLVVALGGPDLSHVLSVGTVSRESTQVTFGSTPATMRLLICPQLLGKI